MRGVNKGMMRREMRGTKIVKKAGILAMTALLAMSTLTMGGCAQSGADTSADGRTELVFWYSGGKTAVGVWDKLIAEFNASQELYTVTGVTQADYDETYQKVQAGIASKTAADVVLLDADKARNLAEKKLLEDISVYVKEDSSFEKEDYIEVFYEQGVLENGMLFALPAYGTTQVMYYNRAVFEKAGILPETIKTWQDVAAIDTALKNSGQDGVYAWAPMWNADNLIDAAFSNGASFLSEDGKTVMINSPEWVEVWEAFRVWLHDEQIMKIHYGGQGWEYWYKTMDDAVNGVAAGYTGSSGDQADLDFAVVGAMEQPGFGNHPSAPVARALQFVIPANENEAETAGAYAFIRYLSSSEKQAEWSMGTGYVPVIKSTIEDPAYKAYTEENPQALVPFNQAMHGSVLPVDPTGGKIYDALDIAADKVEIENISAKEALDEAQEAAQKALTALQ